MTISSSSTKAESTGSEKEQSDTSIAKPLDSVLLLDLQRQYEQVRAEVLAAVGRVCASQHYILGPEVDAFEREFADFCGVPDAVGCASGTDALWLALVAAGVQPGDSVVTAPFSFFASANAIVRAGARPVFADIDPETLNLDPVQTEKLLRSRRNSRLRALLPVHLYGQCADMDSFQSLSDEFHLSVIEDAAQAVGAAWGDGSRARRAGAMGVSAAFSFYPTKNLSAYGDAGMVTTNDPEMAARMRRLRNHGSPRRYVHEELGWNSRLDAIQAAILRVKLRYVEGWNEARGQRAATYDRLFTSAGMGKISTDQAQARTTPPPHRARPSDQRSTVSHDTPIILPHTAVHARHVFHQYVIRAHRRDELRQFLTARKIGTEIYYPIPLHLQPCFVYLGYREGDLPEAERAAKEVLALPMFPELTDDEQRWVVGSIAEFYS